MSIGKVPSQVALKMVFEKASYKYEKDMKFDMMTILISINHKKKIDKKTNKVWHLKGENQIANFYRGQILGLASLKFKIQINDDEMWWNFMGWFDMSQNDSKILSLKNRQKMMIK